MNLKNWLNTDSYVVGVVLALLLPIPSTVLFLGLLRLVQDLFHFFETVRNSDIILLSLSVNLVVMRYYLVKRKLEKTGKGLLILTVIMILLFFILLKNSNFELPF